MLLVVVGQLERGGLEKQLLMVLDDGNQSGLDITLINWSGLSDEFYLEKVKNLENITYYDYGAFNSLKKSIKLFGLISKVGQVLCFTSYLNFLVFSLSFIRGVKFTGAARISLDYELKRPLGYLNLLMVPNIVSNSLIGYKQLIKWNIFSGHKFVHNRIEVRTNFNEGICKYTSISVGTVNERKNLDCLFVIAKYCLENKVDFCHIHLGDGPLLAEYRDKVISMGLVGKLNFIGQTPDTESFFDSSGLFFHFSRYEGTPNVVMEALNNGLKVIALDCGDIKELVTNESQGVIIDDFDLDTFINELKDFNSNRKEKNSGRVSLINDKYLHKGDGSYINEFIF